MILPACRQNDNNKKRPNDRGVQWVRPVFAAVLERRSPRDREMRGPSSPASRGSTGTKPQSGVRRSPPLRSQTTRATQGKQGERYAANPGERCFRTLRRGAASMPTSPSVQAPLRGLFFRDCDSVSIRGGHACLPRKLQSAIVPCGPCRSEAWCRSGRRRCRRTGTAEAAATPRVRRRTGTNSFLPT